MGENGEIWWDTVLFDFHDVSIGVSLRFPWFVSLWVHGSFARQTAWKYEALDRPAEASCAEKGARRGATMHGVKPEQRAKNKLE